MITMDPGIKNLLRNRFLPVLKKIAKWLLKWFTFKACQFLTCLTSLIEDHECFKKNCEMAFKMFYFQGFPRPLAKFKHFQGLGIFF